MFDTKRGQAESDVARCRRASITEAVPAWRRRTKTVTVGAETQSAGLWLSVIKYIPFYPHCLASQMAASIQASLMWTGSMYVFFSSTARTITLFLRWEEFEISIKQPVLCTILPGVRENGERSFMRDIGISELCFWAVAVRNIFTSLLCLIASSSGSVRRAHYSPKSDFLLTYTWSMQDLTHALPAVHLQKAALHANDAVSASHIAPSPALPSDSIEHHRWVYFSPNGADKAAEPPQSYLSSPSAPHKEFFSRAM